MCEGHREKGTNRDTEWADTYIFASRLHGRRERGSPERRMAADSGSMLVASACGRISRRLDLVGR